MLLESSWNTAGRNGGTPPGEIGKASYLCGVSHLFYMHENKHSFLLTLWKHQNFQLMPIERSFYWVF